jgi:hypothetical protein
MMQYLIWMSAIAGLMVFAVEAVVGGAFWAFAHVRADGGEFVNQQQAYGYKILLNCVFRPLLTVVGLIFSSIIMCVMAQLIDNTFGLAAQNSGIGTLYDPVSILALLILLYYVHYQVVMRSLRVITLLPNAVMDWAGHGGHSTQGYEAVFADEDVNKRAYGFVGTYVSGGAGAAGKGAKGGAAAAAPSGKGTAGNNGDNAGNTGQTNPNAGGKPDDGGDV